MTKRTPAQYDWDKALFNDRRLSKHYTSPRRKKIKHVTLHHSTIVGKGDAAALETMFKVWQNRAASAHYGVDGKYVWQYVSDFDAAWSNGDKGGSNHESLTIEHTNSTAGPKWEISDDTMRTGARLVATLHRLYKLGRPTRKTVKVHRDFYATACPGPYMMANLDAYIKAAAEFYDGETPTPTPDPVPSGKVKHTHFRKPHEPLTVGKEWVDVRGYVGTTYRRWFYTLAAKGAVEIECYLPGAHHGDEAGKVEFRAVRASIMSGKKVIEPIDPTAYDSRVVLANDGDVRIRFHYKGPWKWPLRKIKIQARYTGPGKYVTTGTHYADFWHYA